MSLCENLQSRVPAAKQFAEKGFSGCHSERSEESLCAECQEKERFLVAPLLGMTRLRCFSPCCSAACASNFELSHTLCRMNWAALSSTGAACRRRCYEAEAIFRLRSLGQCGLRRHRGRI